MGSAENKAVLRRIFDEVINRKRLDLVDGLYSEQHELHAEAPGVGRGAEGMKRAFAGLHEEFPDVRVDQLGTRFTDADRLRNLLYRDWARVATDELFFLPGEQTHGEGERLTEAVNVERLALAYWSKLAPYLS